MNNRSSSPKPTRLFALIAPGILVAATGVGAGDLLTASLGGSKFGLAILWAAVAGAILKWFLNEGVARWQMATGTTLLEGWVQRLGRWVQWVFPVYLVIWTFATCGALASACGVAGTALLPIGDDPGRSRIVHGVLHSLVGYALVRAGGFKLFEKLMAACIAIMFVAVMFTAVVAHPEWAAVKAAAAGPMIPAGGFYWILGVLGGVGGSVTLLSYGYWIQEQGRAGAEGVRTCRIDLGVGYAMTALFGMAMIVIGSRLRPQGSGAMVAVDLAAELKRGLGGTAGTIGRWVFLAGFWGAVFSSLLGVWQSVPYMFTDFLLLVRGVSEERRRSVNYEKTSAYRWYLAAMATIPLVLLWGKVDTIQLTYAVLAAMFIPLLALTLLIMNNRTDWVGQQFRNRWVTNVVLVVAMLFFLLFGGRDIGEKLGWLEKQLPGGGA